MYGYTRTHISPIPTQSVPIISPPVVQPVPLQNMRYYEYHHQYPAHDPQRSPHLEHRPSQPFRRQSGVPGPYVPPTPSAEFAALYMSDRDEHAHTSHRRSHSRGRAPTQISPRIHAHEPSAGRTPADRLTLARPRTKEHHTTHIPATSRKQAQAHPVPHGEHRERGRGRTLQRNERRPSVSEASHIATLGGTSSRGHTHSSRPAIAHTSRKHQHQQQPASRGRTTNTTIAPAPATAHKHASSQNHKHATQSHARDHQSHVHAHNTTQPPIGHGHTYPPAHHHPAPGSSSLGVAYVPTAAPSNPHPSRSPRDYSHLQTDETRARSQSAPRHRTLRPGRSAMKNDYGSRSRSRVRFGQERRPVKPIAIPVGGRSRSRKPGVDFGWLRVPR